MRVVEKIIDMKAISKAQNRKDVSIGFVPTMGYLHDGHKSLISSCVAENEFTILSIFVNPTQFGPNEDYEKYPRDLDKDIKIAEELGVDVVFIPDVSEMYPDGYLSYVEVDEITQKLCGADRPGHFKGVCTVVIKLFNIVRPHRAYFGQKDAQQMAVIRKMVHDLNVDVEVIACPIIREADGLAMSSRNVYLSDEERRDAVNISRALVMAQEMVAGGEINIEKLKKTIKSQILKAKGAKIQYIEVIDANTLNSIKKIENDALALVAVKIGKTRLIDNILLEV